MAGTVLSTGESKTGKRPCPQGAHNLMQEVKEGIMIIFRGEEGNLRGEGEHGSADKKNIGHTTYFIRSATVIDFIFLKIFILLTSTQIIDYQLSAK